MNILCERLLTQAYVEEKTRVTLTDVDNTLQDMEDEWRTSVTVADNPSASKSARLQDMERRMASLDASLDQISQVINTILV